MTIFFWTGLIFAIAAGSAFGDARGCLAALFAYLSLNALATHVVIFAKEKPNAK